MVYKDPNYKHNWYLKNMEKVKARRIKWYHDNKEKELNRNYNYRRENPEKIKELKRNDAKLYYNRHPEKVKAQQLACNKITITNGQLCENCKVNPAKERHHPDYSKPLEVKFLCTKCHNKIHHQEAITPLECLTQ